MKLSVITINYNNAAGLRQTLENISTQTYQAFEYLVIDGGSNDGSVEVIRQFESRISYWVSEQDRGIYNAMNKGLQQVHGEYILFVNSGDLLCSGNSLEELIPFLNGEDIVYGDYMVNEQNKTWIKEYPDELLFSHFVHDSLPHTAAAFIKKSAFKNELAAYDEGFKIISDWKWYLIGLFRYNYTYRHIPKTIGIFDFSGVSATNPDKLQREKIKVFEEEFPAIFKEISALAEFKRRFILLEGSKLFKAGKTLKNIVSKK